MFKNAGSLNKNKKIVKFNVKKSSFTIILIVFALLFSFFIVFICNNDFNVIAGSSYYTPASPLGTTVGSINVDYEYIEYTSEDGSYWMFDWGDGNYSDWIQVGESDTFISQTHSWDSYGIYEIRIKHRSIYMAESEWSPPLIVTITIPSDLDSDGWSNEVEEAYGKNPADPNEYPKDTDGDGIPDEDSLNGKYTGDFDDDNDGLSDTIEISLGSNPKDGNDAIGIIIEGVTYYLVDTNGNANIDILYNKQAESQITTAIENKKICLDINGDGSWDYTYYEGQVERYEGPFPWLYLIITIILIVVIIIFLLFKKGIFYLYEEEYVVEE